MELGPTGPDSRCVSEVSNIIIHDCIALEVSADRGPSFGVEDGMIGGDGLGRLDATEPVNSLTAASGNRGNRGASTDRSDIGRLDATDRAEISSIRGAQEGIAAHSQQDMAAAKNADAASTPAAGDFIATRAMPTGLGTSMQLAYTPTIMLSCESLTLTGKPAP